MNDIENITGSFDNDNYVLDNGNSDVSLENDSLGEEETSEETSTQRDTSSGDLDLSEVLTKLDNLEVQNEDIISSLSVIEDNSQYLASVKDATGILTNAFIFALIIALIILTYNVLNNFFK